MKKIFIPVYLLLFTVLPIFADTFSPTATYQVCFTPGENCTQEVVDIINKAKKQILVQAYAFTSTPIARALIQAKQRGVDVKVLLDKTQVKTKYSSATYLLNNAIWVRIDAHPVIAHNKVILVDNSTLITGSFNFTKAANDKNAENLWA